MKTIIVVIKIFKKCSKVRYKKGNEHNNSKF